MLWSHLGPATVAFLAIGFFLGGTANAEVCSGGDSCCTSRPEKCGISEGDCDNDSECAGNLRCGSDNCGSRPGFDGTDDCCEIDPTFKATTTTTTTTTTPRPNPLREEYCAGVKKAYQIMSTTGEALGCKFEDTGDRGKSPATCSDISCLVDIMNLPSCGKTPADCKMLTSILESMTMGAVRYCGWKDSNHDDPYREGTKSLQGYTCYDNILDKEQHCKCKPGEKLSLFSSKFTRYNLDRVWALDCAKIEPEFIVENDLDWITQTEYNNWDGPLMWNGIAQNAFMVGMQSYHDNNREDRRFHIMWTKSKYWDLVECTDHKQLNTWREDINYQLYGNQVIAALSSYHENDYEDRIWYITICKLEKKCTQMVSTVYDYDGAKETVDKSKFAGMNYFNNLNGAAQKSVTAKMDVRSSEGLVNSYSFQRTSGHETTASLDVTAGMSWGLGVTGSLEVSAGFSSTWSTSSTWTRSNSKQATTENGQEISFTSNCPSRCFCQLEVQVDFATASIPYTLTTRTKGSTNTADYCVEKGVMKGVKTWNARAISNDTCTTKS